LLAKIEELPAIITYGQNRENVISKVKVLALWVIADRAGHGALIIHKINKTTRTFISNKSRFDPGYLHRYLHDEPDLPHAALAELANFCIPFEH